MLLRASGSGVQPVSQQQPRKQKHQDPAGGSLARWLASLRFKAGASVVLRLREAGGSVGESRRFNPRSAVSLWVPRLLLLGHTRPRRCGGSWGGAGGLRQEEAEFGGLLQGPGVGSSPLLHLCPTILPPLGHGVQDAASGGVGSGGAGLGWRRRRRSWASLRQWVLAVLAGGLKYLWLNTNERFCRYEAADVWRHKQQRRICPDSMR